MKRHRNQIHILILEATHHAYDVIVYKSNDEGRARIFLKYSVVLILCLVLINSCFSGDRTTGHLENPKLKLSINPRVANAPTGSDFITRIEPMELPQREQAILDEILQDNIPGFLRNLVAVTTSLSIEQTRYNLTFYVVPDYLSIGSNADHILMPMTPMLAQKVVEQLGGILPTRKMVDLIWEASDIKLTPQPIPPSLAMVSVAVFRMHNSMVETSRAEFTTEYPLGSLVSGHKKDVILSNRIASKPDKVIIYGWHHPHGKAIQPLYSGHVNWYADYSHGIRVVLNQCLLNDSIMDISEVLTDPLLHQLLSDEEGAMETTRYDTSWSNYP